METVLNKKQPRGDRNDAIVTARVPVEIKRQGNAVLKQIGSTPTELVNSAYAYVLEHGGLPTDRPKVCPGRRELNANQKDKLIRRGRNMLVKPGGDLLDGRPFKEVLSEMRYADYEALS